MSELTVPKEWAKCNISDVISANGMFCDGDWVESKDQDPNGEVRLIQLADIGGGYFKNKSERFLTKEKAGALNCTFLNKGDLLIARLPDPLGRACLFPLREPNRYVTVVDVCIVRPNTEKSNSYFLLHLVNSPGIRAEIEKYKSGTTRKRISRKNLAKVLLPIAPLPEQNQIVSIIEQLFSDLDNAIDNLKKAKDQLKIYRQSVLKYAFEGKLTKNNNEYKNVELRTACGTVQNVSKAVNPNTPFLYIDIGCINNASNRIVRNKKYQWKNAPSRAKQIIKSGDILFSTVRTYLKNIAMVSEKYDDQIGSTGFCIIRPKKDRLDSKYIFHYVLWDKFINDISTFQTGTSYPAVRDDDVFSKTIPLPALPIQKRIAQEIESRFSVCDKMEEAIANSLEQADALRQSILKQAFEGKLTEEWRKNHLDLISGENSAEALLEKIESEKEALQVKMKKKQKDSQRC